MKIAIIGGAGFIGTNLTHLLCEAGHDVRILDIVKSSDFPELSVIANVEDASGLIDALKGIDVIYNLAAEHRDDVSPIEKYYNVNVEGARSIVAAAEANGITSIIFTSSVAVYGLDAGESVESDMPSPFNDYGQSKLNAEKVFNDWLAVEDTKRTLVTMRLVATFGEGNRGNIYTLINQIACNKFIMIGAGGNYKSVAYVKNVASFLQHCLGFDAGAHLYNYADKPDLNMREMVLGIRSALGKDGLGLRLPYMLGLAGGAVFDILAKITGRKFPISVIRVKKFCAGTVVNADKLEETGFKRGYSLNQGLDEMVKAEFKNPPSKKHKKPKLLYVINHIDWFWSHRLPLAIGAQKDGYDVHVAVTGAEDDEKLASKGFHGHALPASDAGFMPLTMLKTIWAVSCLMRDEQPDIVHAITLKYAFIAGLAGRLHPDVKLVHTLAGLGYLFAGDGVKPKVLRILISPLLKLAFKGKNTELIFQNPDDMALLLSRGLAREEQCTLIRGSGVDTDEFSPQPESGSESGSEDKNPIVVMPTRLVHDKGVAVFIEAARILKSQGIEARYQIAGGVTTNNPLAISKGEMEAMIAGSDGAAEWLGRVSDMPALLAGAALVVYPSYYREGIPKVLLESAAMGKAIITTDHPGCREAVAHNDNGLLVPVKDAEATAKAIKMLLSDNEKRISMGVQSRKKAEKEFDVRLIVEKTLAVYKL